MELALSLGDPSKPFSFLDKKQARPRDASGALSTPNFGSSCMGLGLHLGGTSRLGLEEEDDDGDKEEEDDEEKHRSSSSSSDQHQHQPPLELLPFSPVPRPHRIRSGRFSTAVGCEAGSSELKRVPPARATSLEEQSSPNSAGSSFMEFTLCRRTFGGGKRLCSDRPEAEAPAERAASRGSDDDEGGSARKKLRLSKEQSAFLEESFKEHHTLNPKQKLGLAKQLNLRPRQVEVWFQNRRARTKLKQTEVDCEYLKRCCETLTEENRRLQKEVQELRALKSCQPFYMQPPATTLTMCPSCERVAPTAGPTPVLPFGGPQPQAQAQAHKPVS